MSPSPDELDAHRLGALRAAHQKPVSVKPDEPLSKATTLMLRYDYSQLPVMTTPSTVKGMVSWRSVGSRLAVSKRCETVREAMDEPPMIFPSDASLLEAVRVVVESDCILVRARDGRISGIVTASDLASQFRDLSERFLLIEKIELLLRRLVSGRFGLDDIIAARDGRDTEREIRGVADLTIGEIIALLQRERNWVRLGLDIDRRVFVEHLDRARKIRNDIMHFRPGRIDSDALEALRSFARFLERLHDLGAID